MSVSRSTFHISETSKWLVSPFERSDSLQNTFGKHEADETDFFSLECEIGFLPGFCRLIFDIKGSHK